ncbi:MAG: YdjY domain-containing protein [candidate division Zixibacteria bacterium]|nr:YdjY domain-containing protein [candidate division Zixibacteria bacterium]
MHLLKTESHKVVSLKNAPSAVPTIVLAILFLLIICNTGGAQVAQTADSVSAMPDTTFSRIDENHYAIGNLKLDVEAREIEIPGWVNMNEGQVEYLAVTKYGKTHESVVVLDIVPIHLQLSLLLFGMEYGQNLNYQGDSTVPGGDSVAIFIKWVKGNGDTAEFSANELLYDFQLKKNMSPTEWVFTGSGVFDGRFMADLDGSIIAVYSDPVAILNNPLSGRYDDTVYGSNKELLPPPGTKIMMTIRLPE